MDKRTVARMFAAYVAEDSVAHVCPTCPAQAVEPEQHRRDKRAARLRLVHINEFIGEDHSAYRFKKARRPKSRLRLGPGQYHLAVAGWVRSDFALSPYSRVTSVFSVSLWLMNSEQEHTTETQRTQRKVPS